MPVEVGFKRHSTTDFTVKYREVKGSTMLYKMGYIYVEKWALKAAFQEIPEDIHVSISTPIQK